MTLPDGGGGSGSAADPTALRRVATSVVAADGGVSNYGDATFHGSAGNLRLYKPVIGLTRTVDGGGYWLVAPDGGVFNYGDAGFYGSLGNDPGAPPTTGIIANPDAKGYKLIGTNGAAASFGT